jgi:predicted transcriptional regulator
MADDSKNMDGFMDGILMERERCEYEVSVKNYWDYNSTMKTAATNASNERAKKIAQNLKAMNVMTAVQIAEATGLTAEEIEGL